jgi:potassium efflux system protein
MWASVLPAVQFLDSFTLWPSEVGENREVIQWVTLGGLLKALPIILLTFVAVRNVPGLLEYALLQKLPLENAARYAITTLSSYAMLMAGVLLTAHTLGLHWESIQWLVAALGVGLGFGLQEIFANFISGIILLFEQPIRVGDVVTIDGTTGAVSKIRMRATTVVNWDRQELIIPNKDLITGRVINWTLSDSTNRIVLNVGIAYGSDTRAACGLLESICREHENVADDPAPIISFEGFGDSTLNLVVRCYLRSLDVRLQTIHDMHTNINDRFSQAGIEIAFPQRDLHIRSLPAGFGVVSQDGQTPRAA